MEMDMLPLFNNSCGKIFRDEVVFASSNRENHLKTESIQGLKLKGTVSLKSLGWVAISSSFFGILYLERNIEGWMYGLIFIIALLFTGLSLYMLERNYYILLVKKDGTQYKIRVDKDNRKDAQKFVDFFRKKKATK